MFGESRRKALKCGLLSGEFDSYLLYLPAYRFLTVVANDLVASQFLLAILKQIATVTLCYAIYKGI